MMDRTLTRAYRRGELVAERFSLDQVSDYLDERDTVVWVDLTAPSDGDVEALAEELGLHELAVEDAMGPRQRPKVDRYATHLFITVYHVAVDPVAGRMEELEVNVFFNDRWLITMHKTDGFPIEAVTARWDSSPKLARHGVGYLLYGLLDVVVDGYFAALESFDDYYETVSEGIFSEHPLEPSQQRQWFDIRRESVRFHRLVVPMREVVSSLMRREQDVVSEALFPYYQDVYDHILRISESSDALRDLVAALVEANLSLRDFRQNLIVKKVSSWAAIVAVPALITGYYGMNVPYPGAGQLSGVIASAVLIVGVSVAMYLLFRRNDWL